MVAVGGDAVEVDDLIRHPKYDRVCVPERSTPREHRLQLFRCRNHGAGTVKNCLAVSSHAATSVVTVRFSRCESNSKGISWAGRGLLNRKPCM
jgi:hypothetical protein